MQGKYGRTRPYYGDFTGQLQVLDSGPVTLSDFTDGEAKTGHYDIPKKLPAGAIPLAWKATTTVGFDDEVEYTPTDGTKIRFVQDAPDDEATDVIVDLTNCYVFEAADPTTIAFVASGSTITDTASGFPTDEFSVNDYVFVEGTSSGTNDNVFKLTAVTADTLTASGATLVNESVASGSTLTITKVNNASSGGLVDIGFVSGDGITITGATTSGNNTTISGGAVTTVTAGMVLLSAATLAETEPGVDGVSFTKEITTTATIEVGVSSDTDRFSADTLQSVATAGVVGSSSLAADACDGIGDDQTVRITVTEEANDNFTDYNKGTVSVKLLYLK